MERFVNNLNIPQCRCNNIKFFSNIVTSIKKYHFKHFPVKFTAIIETTELRLLMFFIEVLRES